MPNLPLRAAVLGAGWYAAQNHIPVLQARPEVVLDSVSRLGQDELERVKTHFGFAFASESAEDVLARRPDIVVVATPHQLHYRFAKAALEGGAHVLVEKPMTLDPAEAWELLAFMNSKEQLEALQTFQPGIKARDDVPVPNSEFLTTTASTLLPLTTARPNNANYSKVSSEIQRMTEAVVSGEMSPEDAMAQYKTAVTAIVGADNTVSL